MSKWCAEVKVKWNNNAPNDWSWLKEWSEVKWAGSTMGDWDLTLWVDVDNPDKLESIITKLRGKDWVTDTHSTWTREVWAA